METIDVVVKGVKVVVNDKRAKVYITTDKEFKGFKQVDGVTVDADVNYFSSARYPLIQVLSNLNEDIAMFKCMFDGEFCQKEFGGLLFGAKLTITRELKAAGEIVDDEPLERDAYITRITKIELSERSRRLIDDFLKF